MATNDVDQTVRIIQHLLIGEAQNGPAEVFDRLLAVMVVEDHVIAGVDAAVDLDDQTEALAGEVGVEAADGMLAAEFVTVDAAGAQVGPDAALGEAGCLAQTACIGGSAGSHGRTMQA